MAWVDEACGGFFAKEQAGTLKQTDVYVFRVAAMLDDFAVHGAVLRRYSRSVSKLSAEQAEVLAAVSGVAAGGGLRGLDGPGVWHGRRGVPRVHRRAAAGWPRWTAR